ncbi:proline iminopeptidase-family hydrolase [Leucobacter musarum]|uniref:proline iminopeptidase-family hydrolase n=1 Tax=Leucobacter musarum TaxID=1930747 RepID=UPI000A77919C|nr:proline iminopeptidase-family hydrolase [Leucobacter musarum]
MTDLNPTDATTTATDVTVAEGTCAWREGSTYFRIARGAGATGSGARIAPGEVPLIAVHGGPGCTHDYLLSLDDLAQDRPVVYYDQLGSGRSTHLPEAPRDFWTIELFLEELDTLLAHLGVEQYDLLGQSWGGMLGSEHAVRRPRGLRRLVIADSPASMPLWREAALGLRAELPEAARDAIAHFESIGDFTAPEYLAASDVFYARHVCRVQPLPAPVQRTFDLLDADPTVYHAMNGPSEFMVIGSLRDWSVIDRLDRIEVPTLVLNGAHDEATDAVVQPFVERIPQVGWVRFEASSHMPHWEEREEFMRVVGEFLG